MTHEELIKEIKQLSIEERLAVIDAISESVREEPGGGEVSGEDPVESRGGGDAKSKALRVSIVDQLYGIAKPDGPMPSEAELKEDYIRYLTEKYS